jgi:hypothetical protein
MYAAMGNGNVNIVEFCAYNAEQKTFLFFLCFNFEFYLGKESLVAVL